MPKILATEIRSKGLLVSHENLQAGLKCYHLDVDGRGGAYENIKRA